MRKYFGTDGIRRIANTELTPEFALKVAKAGACVLSKHSEHTPTILIGRDTRLSGCLLESAMTAGFLSYGANVKILGVMPTPAVAYLTRKLNADAGVVISASHNTFEFNGIKYFSNKGTKIPDNIEEEIERVLDSGKIDELKAEHKKIGVYEIDNSLEEEYINFFKSIFKDKLNKKNTRKFKVAIDTANGATYKVAEKVFNVLGIEHTIINNNPNGININENCGSTHLENLKEFVLNNKYDLGIAYDGDGDRCLAIDENGKILDGDCILAIISDKMKRDGKLKNNTLVATVMSNLGLNKYCLEQGMNIKQTKVGDRYVLEEMLANDYNLGGEQSGHIIFLDYNPTGDGILTSLMLIDTILEKNLSTSECANLITIYPQILVNVKVKQEKKSEYKKDKVITEAIEELEKMDEIGRVLIRPSGTEPLVRIMLEGKDKDFITKKANELAKLMENRLQ